MIFGMTGAMGRQATSEVAGADKKGMSDRAWEMVLAYLRHIGRHDVGGATELLTATVEHEGIGAVNDALADVCRSLMDRVVFPAGTVDLHAVVDRVVLRIIELSGDEQPGALDRLRSLVVFLGSEGLPCAARDDVASWEPDDRLHDSIACMLGLVGIVAGIENATTADAVARITPPGPAVAPDGTFGLAWRGPNGAEPFAGVVPRGYTAHITFLGEQTCSLRAIFARVALLRDEPMLATTDATTAATPPGPRVS
jgi:hypothetical protein